jgi:hypothetical protein
MHSKMAWASSRRVWRCRFGVNNPPLTRTLLQPSGSVKCSAELSYSPVMYTTSFKVEKRSGQIARMRISGQDNGQRHSVNQ